MAEDKKPVIVGRGKAVEHAKDPKAALRFLWSYLSRFKLLLLFALFLTLTSNTLALVGPELSGTAIDALKGKGMVDFETAFRYAAIMAVFFVVSAALSYGLSLLMRSITQKIIRKMRQDVFDKLMTLPVSSAQAVAGK